MQSSSATLNAGSQLDPGDLDMLLDSHFADLSAFPWPDPLSALTQASTDMPPPPVQVTLGQEDLFGRAWQSDAQPLYSKANNTTLQPLMFENDFGASFDLPEAASQVPDHLANGLLTPQRPLGLDSRQASGNLLALSPGGLSTAQSTEDGDIRVTFKDKMNPPADSSKALSLAERNKQAQRRHRQRQKDRMGTLEAQVKQLNEEKQVLAADKATLAGQNAVLTQVLQMRDEQLQHFREKRPPNYAPQPTVTAASGVKSEEVADNGRNAAGAVSSGLADSLANILTLTVRQDQEIKLSPSQVKAMSPQEVSRMWAEYLSAMMKELQHVDRGTGPHATVAESRIKLLLQEVLVLLMRYALGDLHKMKTFVVSYLDTSRENARLSSERRDTWRSAAHNMDLNEQQRKALIQLRQLYMSKQNKLVTDRLSAIAAMHVAIPNPASSHDIALQFLKTGQAIKEVQNILHKENQLIVDLVYTVLLKVVNPIQAARCLVSSYPSYPDSLCILTWIAAEAGHEEAMKLLDYKPSNDGLSSTHSFSDGQHSA